MRVLELLDDGNVVELDVEVLVHALQRAAELDVVLELHRDLLVDERLEEAICAAPGCQQEILRGLWEISPKQQLILMRQSPLSDALSPSKL